MRPTGWVFLIFLLCTVPMALGLAAEQEWPAFVTYGAWGVLTVVMLVRGVRKKGRPRVTGAVAGAGEVYNDLYLSRPASPVSYGPSAGIGTAQPVDRADPLAEGRVVLDRPDRNS